MQCPLCNSRQIMKDYAPPRGYALALAGLVLLFAKSFFNPILMQPAIADEGSRMLILGAAMLFYGTYYMFRHNNRYCAACGFKFRKPHAGASRDNEGLSLIERAQAKAATQTSANTFGVDFNSQHSKDDKDGKKHAKIKIQPLLACLKFKDPVQRANAAETLRQISGQDFGEDYDAWKKWHEDNRKT